MRKSVIVGQLQFDFLVGQGLTPDMKFLDIGCGPFRTGRYIIPYLEDGNYFGIDRKDYSYPIKNMTKSHTFKQTETFELFDEKFDMIFAWSVFTHLRDVQISDCLSKVVKVMKESSKFFSSYFPPRGEEQNYGKLYKTNNFVYPLSFFAEQAKWHGLNVDEIEAPLNNENQRMLLWGKNLLL